MESGGELIAEFLVEFNDGIATASYVEETEEFDMVNMRWKDSSSGKWVTIDQCKSWADATREKTKSNEGDIPAEVKSFVSWTIDPSFTLENTSNGFNLVSGIVDYQIEGSIPSDNTDDYFKYAILNSYKKAMVQRKLPPFPELKALDEMKSRGSIPAIIYVTIPGVPNSPDFKMIFSKD
jgi:hypothetical protein